MSLPPVLVTGLHAADNPSPGLAVARCLQAGGRRVVGLCYSATETGAHDTGVFEEVWRMPRPELDLPAYLDALGRVTARTGARTVMPTLDPEVAIYARERASVEALGLTVLVPEPHVLRRVHKSHLAEVGRACGFHVPRLVAVYTLAEARKVARRMGLPLMVKGAWYEAHRIDHLDELPAIFRALAYRWGRPVLLQALADGAEAVVACLCDRPGRLARTLAMRKLGMSDQGTTWCGVTFRNEALLESCTVLLSTLGWLGPCEVEVLLHETTGMFTLIEVNTRFPSWIGIGPKVGSNLPFDAVCVAEGQPLPEDPGYLTGRAMVRRSQDHVVLLGRLIALDNGGHVGS